MKFDENILDLVLGAVSVLAAAAFVGFGSIELGGIGMSDHFVTLADGYTMDYHHFLTILTFAGAGVINTPSWSRLNSSKKVLITGSLGLVSLSIISPDTVADLFSTTTAELLGVGFLTGGYWGIAHS